MLVRACVLAVGVERNGCMHACVLLESTERVVHVVYTCLTRLALHVHVWMRAREEDLQQSFVYCMHACSCCWRKWDRPRHPHARQAM